MAVMVWCNGCKTVVWAYDHQSRVDLRGLCNILQLPCPKCGDIGNFDGWESDNPYEQLGNALSKAEGQVYDDWSAMKYVARAYKVEWEPSPDNTWFRRPYYIPEEYERFMTSLRGVIQDHYTFERR